MLLAWEVSFVTSGHLFTKLTHLFPQDLQVSFQQPNDRSHHLNQVPGCIWLLWSCILVTNPGYQSIHQFLDEVKNLIACLLHSQHTVVV